MTARMHPITGSNQLPPAAWGATVSIGTHHELVSTSLKLFHMPRSGSVPSAESDLTYTATPQDQERHHHIIRH